MKASEKNQLINKYFNHVLVIGLATSLTLVMMSVFLMKPKTVIVRKVNTNPTQVQEAQAATESYYPEVSSRPGMRHMNNMGSTY